MPGSAISPADFRPATLVQNRMLHAAIGLRQRKWQLSKVLSVWVNGNYIIKLIEFCSSTVKYNKSLLKPSLLKSVVRRV